MMAEVRHLKTAAVIRAARHVVGCVDAEQARGERLSQAIQLWRARLEDLDALAAGDARGARGDVVMP